MWRHLTRVTTARGRVINLGRENMGKERDWIDYAQLGLTAAQAFKINEMAAQVVKLQQTAADQEKKSQRLSQMRQMVLMAEELLERLESAPEAETSLQRKFVNCFEIEEALKLAGVFPPLALESYEDKERVGRLEKRVDALRAKTANAMPNEQRRDAELCVKYMAEEPDLKWLIMVRSEPEAIKEKEKRLQEIEAELEARHQANPLARSLQGMAALGLGFIVIALVMLLGTGALKMSLFPESDLITNIVIFFSILLLAGCGLFLLYAVLWLLNRSQLEPKEIRDLEAESDRLVEELPDPEADPEKPLLIDPYGRDPKKITKKFGGESSAEQLRQMWIERRDFVRGIVGNNYLSQHDKKPEDTEAGEEDQES